MKEQESVESLKDRIKDLESRIENASILLWDYDGYYDPIAKKGDAEKLASLIDDAYTYLQGKHWDKHEPLPDEHHDIEE